MLESWVGEDEKTPLELTPYSYPGLMLVLELVSYYANILFIIIVFFLRLQARLTLKTGLQQYTQLLLPSMQRSLQKRIQSSC